MYQMPPARPLQDALQSVPLLALPDSLLVAVLQCLAAANHKRSLFNAALTHSRLHQAAVQLVSSIAVTGIRKQREADGVLLYLRKHKQHVRSLSLGCFEEDSILLRQLALALQLHSLELGRFDMQLLPAHGFRGVLGYDGVSALTQLRLKSCTLLDDPGKLTAALAQLPPGLQHLALDKVDLHGRDSLVTVPIGALQQRLQQLTHLELLRVAFQWPAHQASPAPQPQQQPQVFSRLVDLRLSSFEAEGQQLPAGLLSGAASLTRLELAHLGLPRGELAGKTQLQHLSLQARGMGGADWVPTLLSQLEPLQQLTHLQLRGDLAVGAPPPAAFSALTASSRLQHLDINSCTLPAGVWQHMFPVGRQLPHLTAIVAADVKQPPGGAFPGLPRPLAVSDGSCVVSCCPGLRCLDVTGLACSPGVFAPLSGLSALHTLLACTDSSQAVREVCRLTGLRELHLDASNLPFTGKPLLQTTQLRQLTKLSYTGPHNGGVRLYRDVYHVTQAPGDEPVWRQVLRAHLDHRDKAVAQAAPAALEAE